MQTGTARKRTHREPLEPRGCLGGRRRREEEIHTTHTHMEARRRAPSRARMEREPERHVTEGAGVAGPVPLTSKQALVAGPPL